MKALVLLLLAVAVVPFSSGADDHMTVIVQTDDVVRQGAENKQLLSQTKQLQADLNAALITIAALKLDLTCSEEKLAAAVREIATLPMYKKADIDAQRTALESRLDHLEASLVAENKLLKQKLAAAAKLQTDFPN